MNINFNWLDSFTKQKKTSPQATIECISSLYNYAVASARQACFMDLAGDGIKNASKYFSQAAWVFEHLQTLVTQLPAGEATLDFSKESLNMSSNLCLAQA